MKKKRKLWRAVNHPVAAVKPSKRQLKHFSAPFLLIVFFFLPLLSACGFEKAGRNLCERNYSITFAVLAHLMVRKKRV